MYCQMQCRACCTGPAHPESAEGDVVIHQGRAGALQALQHGQDGLCGGRLPCSVPRTLALGAGESLFRSKSMECVRHKQNHTECPRKP